MASTYTAGRALTLLQAQLKIPDVSPFAAIVLDETLQWMWNAYDWRGSLAVLPPFFLVPEESDYGPPASVIPADFHQLRSARLVSDGETFKQLQIVADLEKPDIFDWPTDIAYLAAEGVFRLHPCPPASFSASEYQVEGTYKKRATQITPTNINSLVLPWDDAYFGVFRSVLKWKMLTELGSPAAGSLVYLPSGQIQASGQAASALYGIMEMARREGVGEPPRQAAPESLFL